MGSSHIAYVSDINWVDCGKRAEDIPSSQEVGGVQLHIVAMWEFVSSVIRALDFPSRGINLDVYTKYFNFKC